MAVGGMPEQVAALPVVEAGLPGSAFPPAVAALASRLLPLPAAPVESGPAAASAGTRCCEGEEECLESETESGTLRRIKGPSRTR